MPMVTTEMDHYAVMYIGGTSLVSREAGARIDCFKGTARVATISFFGDGFNVPNQVLPDGTLALYYEMSRFGDVIDTIRYEKPLALAINSDTGFGYITTTREPVGEQENSPVLTAAV